MTTVIPPQPPLQQPTPIGVIVPLFTAANDSGVYELADITRRYSPRLRTIVIVPIDHPHYTHPELDNAIRMLDIAGAKVVGYLHVQDNDVENKQRIMQYKKYYPMLAGVAFHTQGDEDWAQKVASLSIFTKENVVGFDLVIASVERMSQDAVAFAQQGARYFELTPPGAIDIVLYYFYEGIPQQIQVFNHPRYGPEKFGFAVSKYRIDNTESFRKIVKAVVDNFRVARYVYIEGGKDSVSNFGARQPFRSLSPYLEITMKVLDRIAMMEERNNRISKTKSRRKRVLLGEKQTEIAYDGFGIRKVNRDPGGRSVDINNKFVVGINKGIAHYKVDKPSILQGVHTRTFKPKEAYENLEWTTYIKLADTTGKKTVFDPEGIMYQFAVGFGKRGDNTFYDVNITYGGFIRVGKTVAGTKGTYRPGNGTSYPLSNWLGFKVTYHQFPDPDNNDKLPHHCRIELWMDEHAQDANGNLVVANNQAERWRNVFSTEDTGNWVFETKTVRKTAKTLKTLSQIRPSLKNAITGPILACTLKLAPQIKADVKFMSMREVEPLRED